MSPKPFAHVLIVEARFYGDLSYDIVANESARALQELSIRHNLVIGNGVIAVENEDQAWVRAKKGELNKGGGAAEACLKLIGLKREWKLV